MSEYIKREDAIFAACKVLEKFGGCKMGSLCPDVGCSEVRDIVDQYICEDVIERDEGIRMGAELAAMHGSDATSQDLERAYWTGYEEAMKKRDVRPVVRGRWVGYPECLKYMNAYSDDHIVCSACEECFSILDNDCERFNFCPNCGAYMSEEI